MRRRRRDTEVFSLSFLDCICCGFGAIVLLLVLTKIGEPRAVERARQELDLRVARLQAELAEIRGETPVLERRLARRRDQLAEERELIVRLRADLERIEAAVTASRQDSTVQEIVEGSLLAARQELSAEMKRLQAQTPPPPPAPDRPIGGVPVDSEYIVFVIDTSGSMVQHTWSLVEQKMAEILTVYPRVKGIQVMNDMGQYMFSRYAGKWIPDTPGRRKLILERLRGWNAFSNSSPVEGVTRAIQAFAAPDKKVSVYVFGDDFSGDSISEVIETVDRINRTDATGARRVRIHGIGFPVIFTVEGASDFTAVRFATLMRLLCQENGGAFVGLNDVRP